MFPRTRLISFLLLFFPQTTLFSEQGTAPVPGTRAPSLNEAVDLIAAGLAQSHRSTAAVTVLAFTRPDASAAPLGNLVAIRLTDSLQRTGRFTLVDRVSTAKLMREIQFGLTGAVDPASVQRIGRLTGAAYLVAGTLIPNSGKIFCDARLINVETGEISATARAEFEAEKPPQTPEQSKPSPVKPAEDDALKSAVKKLSLAMARLERDRTLQTHASSLTARIPFVIYDAISENTDALRHLARQKTNSNRHREVWEARAALQRLAGNCAEAERIYSHLLKTQPSPHSYLGLALCIGGSRGIAYAKKVLRRSTQDPHMRWSAYVVRSALHIKHQDFDRARLDLRAAVRPHRGLTGDFLLARAFALLALGNLDDARLDLLHALGQPLTRLDRRRARQLLSSAPPGD